MDNTYAIATTVIILFVAAFIGGVLAKKFRLPLIIGYITVGIGVGNIFGTFIDQTFLQVISDVGVTLLLFSLGVEFSFHRLARVFGKVFWAALLQMLISITLFFFLTYVAQVAFLPSLFFSIAASLSSTAVAVRILSERAELETAAGELIVGWAVLQDLSVIPLMVLLSTVTALGSAGHITANSIFQMLGIVLLKSSVVILFGVVLGRIGVKALLTAVAKQLNREIFLLTTVGIVFFAAIGTSLMGLPASIGAFIAGLLVAETSQNHAVFAEIRPLRDVFAVVFFVSIGLAIPIGFLLQNLLFIVVCVFLVVAIKWGVIYALMRFLEHHTKTSFLVATGLAQISEFGFIIAREGVLHHAFDTHWYLIIMSTTFLSICFNIPFFAKSQLLYYQFLQNVAKKLPRLFKSKNDESINVEKVSLSNHVILCGYGRVGKYIGRALEMAGVPFLVLDYNQYTVTNLRDKDLSVIYGDPADLGVLENAHVGGARAIIIAIPDRHTQELIISNALTLNKKIKIICRTHHEEDQSRLKSLGVHVVVQPEFEAALSVVSRLLQEAGLSSEEIAGKVSRLKIEHGISE